MAKYMDQNGLSYFFQKLKNLFLGKNDTAYRTASIYSGQVDSTSTSTAFTATINGITELRDGVCMMLKNGVVTSAANCTLNVNGLGAKPIYQTLAAATAVTTTFNVNYTMLFVYNSTRVTGGCWDMYYGYNSDNNTLAYNVRDYQAAKNMKSTLYRYMIVFTANDGTLVPSCATSNSTATTKTLTTTSFNPTLPIYYYATTTTVNTGASPSASYMYIKYQGCDLRYGFNVSSSQFTAKLPVYLQLSLQTDGQVKLSGNNCLTQTLPSTSDGYLYLLLGYAYSAYQIELNQDHPIYWYKDGAIRPYSYEAISSVKVNNTALTPSGGAVNITVPTQTSQLTNNSNFVSDASYVHTDNNYTTTEKNKLSGIATGAQVNVIETIKVNNVALTPSSKAVNIEIPSGADWDDVTNKPFDEDEEVDIFTPVWSGIGATNSSGVYSSTIDSGIYNSISTSKRYRVIVVSGNYKYSYIATPVQSSGAGGTITYRTLQGTNYTWSVVFTKDSSYSRYTVTLSGYEPYYSVTITVDEVSTGIQKRKLAPSYIDVDGLRRELYKNIYSTTFTLDTPGQWDNPSHVMSIEDGGKLFDTLLGICSTTQNLILTVNERSFADTSSYIYWDELFLTTVISINPGEYAFSMYVYKEIDNIALVTRTWLEFAVDDETMYPMQSSIDLSMSLDDSKLPPTMINLEALSSALGIDGLAWALEELL